MYHAFTHFVQKIEKFFDEFFGQQNTALYKKDKS